TRGEDNRHKLTIGFASLSNSLPFGQDDLVGDTEISPQTTIMINALRSGVRKFDCPAPPMIESNKQALMANADSDTCWTANRKSEDQLAISMKEVESILSKEEGSLDGEVGTMTISTRMGYRSAVVLTHGNNPQANTDSHEREGLFKGDARVGMLYAGEKGEGNAEEKPPVVLVHNLSKEYVLHSLRTSPLVQQRGEMMSGKKTRLIPLAHNPETQISAHLLSNHNQSDGELLLKEARDYMKARLTSAFVGFEIAVQEGLIDGYGVDSNGLSLPDAHDMHLSWRDVLECSLDALLEVNDEKSGVRRSSLKAIRLPCNLLETRGLEVANEINSVYGAHCTTSEEGLPPGADDQTESNVPQMQRLRTMRNLLPERIEVQATRPLTAYPFGGTGVDVNSSPGLASSPPPLRSSQPGNVDGQAIDATHPLRLLDYRIEAASAGQEPTLLWSNDYLNRYGIRPVAYQPILNAVLSHFDAEEIIEASRERELTVEERETLDGCKLLHGLIHDLDASLDSMRSFAAYEEYLLKKAVSSYLWDIRGT
ncbi:hypothetical protein THAOC_08550, partial [Thalassiosira oceanica]